MRQINRQFQTFSELYILLLCFILLLKIIFSKISNKILFFVCFVTNAHLLFTLYKDIRPFKTSLFPLRKGLGFINTFPDQGYQKSSFMQIMYKICHSTKNVKNYYYLYTPNKFKKFAHGNWKIFSFPIPYQNSRASIFFQLSFSYIFLNTVKLAIGSYWIW